MAADDRRVIIAGFGPVGRVVAQQLEQAGLKVLIIELNAATVNKQKELGKPAVCGDVCDDEVLRQAAIGEADALIITIPNEDAAVAACSTARRIAPDLFIAVRTHHMSNAMRATRAGADHVTIQEIVTAESMQQAVMAKLVGPVGGEGA